MLSWYSNCLGIYDGKDFGAVITLEDHVCYSYPFFVVLSLDVEAVDHVYLGIGLDFTVLEDVVEEVYLVA